MTGSRRPRRWAVLVILGIGIGLAAAPAAFRMFDRAPKGATMIEDFAPYMQVARLDGYRREIALIDAGVAQAVADVPAALPRDAGGTPEGFRRRFPEGASFAHDWEPINADMTALLTSIRANVDEYAAVAALPSFDLFPWFFVVPGALLAVLALAALVRPSSWAWVRWGLVLVGIGLMLAPVAFRMFERAPAGGRMVDAFRTIETRQKVETIQGYFGTIAVGQGAVRLSLVPALRDAGLDDAQIAARFPAVDGLDREWTTILNDLTPMIGVMSDNVGNYAAVAALPPFALFPWFFVLPGLLVAVLVAVAGVAPLPAARQVPAVTTEHPTP